MNYSDIIGANKKGWEETAPIHRKKVFDDLLEKFKEPGYSLLDHVEKRIFDNLKVKGKDVIQLCCNNARELLSVKNIGANRCVGIDLTEGFIKQGKELAKIANQDIELYSMDVYHIPEKFHNSFDIVYITIGAITWLPDLPNFLKIVNKLLREDGYLFLYDYHPILDMYEPESKDFQIPKHSYFKRDPYVEEPGGTDYFDKTAKITSTMYSFPYSLSTIFSTIIESGELTIKEFKEYDHDISNVFKIYEQYNQYPMCFSLIAQK